jgi:hypothetical protein
MQQQGNPAAESGAAPPARSPPLRNTGLSGAHASPGVRRMRALDIDLTTSGTAKGAHHEESRPRSAGPKGQPPGSSGGMGIPETTVAFRSSGRLRSNRWCGSSVSPAPALIHVATSRVTLNDEADIPRSRNTGRNSMTPARPTNRTGSAAAVLDESVRQLIEGVPDFVLRSHRRRTL